jgi:DNA-binding MarR family transcriptional regulator
MHVRLRALVRLGLVERRPDGSPRGSVYVLTDGASELLAALAAAPLNPATPREAALRALASVFHKPVSLGPGTDAERTATTAMEALREA